MEPPRLLPHLKLHYELEVIIVHITLSTYLYRISST